MKYKCILCFCISLLCFSGCGKKEEPPKPQVGIQYDKLDEDGNVIEDEPIETVDTTEIEEQPQGAVEKTGIGGKGLEGLAELQKEFDISDTDSVLNEVITDIPNYLANYIAQYFTKEHYTLDKYKVICDNTRIITKPNEYDEYLIFSLSNYKDVSKAVVNISEIPIGDLYMYKGYLVSLKDGYVKGSLYVSEDTPTVRMEDIGAKSVLSANEQLEF